MKAHSLDKLLAWGPFSDPSGATYALNRFYGARALKPRRASTPWSRVCISLRQALLLQFFCFAKVERREKLKREANNEEETRDVNKVT
jgi:hypothetical protein